MPVRDHRYPHVQERLAPRRANRATKATFVPVRDHRYPHMQER